MAAAGPGWARERTLALVVVVVVVVVAVVVGPKTVVGRQLGCPALKSHCWLELGSVAGNHNW